MMPFRDRLATIAAAPWLRKIWLLRLLYAIALEFDALVEMLRLGARACSPETAPSDALPVLGRERGIRRGFVESVSSYAARLIRWLFDRRMKGNAQATMRQLQGYLTGYEVPIRIVNPQGAWHTLSYQGIPTYYRAIPTNWDWDGVTASWSRYWVILYPSSALWETDGTWNDPGTWDDGGTWDSTATPDQVATVRAIIAEWNPPHAKCAGITIAFDAGAFRPNESGTGFPSGDWGTWGHSVAGNYEAVRLGTASYWDGI